MIHSYNINIEYFPISLVFTAVNNTQVCFNLSNTLFKMIGQWLSSTIQEFLR